MSSQPNQSLIDGIRCLQYLVSSDRAIGCRELARLMDINTTRVNRLLMTMASIGLTMQDEHRRYLPGQAFMLWQRRRFVVQRCSPMRCLSLNAMRPKTSWWH